MKKFLQIIRTWEWDGLPLASPFVIIRRFLMLPFMLAFKWLYVAAVAVGWGLDEAREDEANIGPIFIPR